MYTRSFHNMRLSPSKTNIFIFSRSHIVRLFLFACALSSPFASATCLPPSNGRAQLFCHRSGFIRYHHRHQSFCAVEMRCSSYITFCGVPTRNIGRQYWLSGHKTRSKNGVSNSARSKCGQKRGPCNRYDGDCPSDGVVLTFIWYFFRHSINAGAVMLRQIFMGIFGKPATKFVLLCFWLKPLCSGSSWTKNASIYTKYCIFSVHSPSNLIENMRVFLRLMSDQ